MILLACCNRFFSPDKYINFIDTYFSFELKSAVIGRPITIYMLWRWKNMKAFWSLAQGIQAKYLYFYINWTPWEGLKEDSGLRVITTLIMRLTTRCGCRLSDNRGPTGPIYLDFCAVKGLIYPKNIHDIQLLVTPVNQEDFKILIISPRGGAQDTNGSIGTGVRRNRFLVVDFNPSTWIVYWKSTNRRRLGSGPKRGLVKDPKLNRSHQTSWIVFFAPILSHSNRATNSEDVQHAGWLQYLRAMPSGTSIEP